MHRDMRNYWFHAPNDNCATRNIRVVKYVQSFHEYAKPIDWIPFTNVEINYWMSFVSSYI